MTIKKQQNENWKDNNLMKKNTLYKMDEFEWTHLYMRYVISQLGLKHSFHLVDVSPARIVRYKDLDPLHGWGTPDKKIGGLCLFYLHKDIQIAPFEDFRRSLLKKEPHYEFIFYFSQ